MKRFIKPITAHVAPHLLEPDVIAEPIYMDVKTDYIEIKFDTVIRIDADGSWYSPGNNYSWAGNKGDSHGKWYSPEDYIYLTDASGAAEYIDELMPDISENPPGYYQIRGLATLAFDISNIEIINQGRYEDGSYDEEVYTDEAIVEFNRSESYITDFEIIAI